MLALVVFFNLHLQGLLLVLFVHKLRLNRLPWFFLRNVPIFLSKERIVLSLRAIAIYMYTISLRRVLISFIEAVQPRAHSWGKLIIPSDALIIHSIVLLLLDVLVVLEPGRMTEGLVCLLPRDTVLHAIDELSIGPAHIRRDVVIDRGREL